MKVKRAFTLIELLVVIAIIALLAALTFPVFFRAREAGRKVTCSSNVRQLAQAWVMYAQDWDERTPGGAYTRFADGHARWAPLGGIYYRNWVRELSPADPHWNRPITQDW